MGETRNQEGMATPLARRSLLAGLCALGATGAGIVAAELGPLRRSTTGEAVVLDAATTAEPLPQVTSGTHSAASGSAATASPSASRTASPAASSSASPSASPSATPTPAAASTAAISSYLRTRPGETALAGVDLQTGRTIALRPTSRFITASIVKVDILVALLLRHQAAGTSLTSSQRSLARAMIIRSDNAAASALWSAIGRGAGLAKANKQLGLTGTTPGPTTYWGNTRTTPRDQLRLLTRLTGTSSPLTAAHRAYVLELMEDVVAGQRWGVSAAASGEVALKNGWLATVTDHGLWTVNSIGRIERPGTAPLLLAVLSHGSPSLQTGIATVQRTAKLAGAALTAG